MNALERAVLRAIGEHCPDAFFSDPPLAVPDEFVEAFRTSVCGALQRLQETGMVGAWTISELTMDAVEIRVQASGVLAFSVMRYPVSELRKLAVVADIMDS